MSAMSYLNLAFYRFARLEDPLHWRQVFREYCAGKAFRGTLLFSQEGLNGMLSGEEPALREFQAFLRGIEVAGARPFADVEFKESWSSEITFPRMLVKVKKEIIPLGLPWVDPLAKTGARMTAAELKAWLDEQRDFVLLDTRNDYEVDYGTFGKAKSFGLKNFRDFPEQLKALPEETRDKPLVMFCTGGIRCEKASAVAMEMGFKEVYQLDGGILKYFEDVGGDHYQGNCFVFDQRVAIDPALGETGLERPAFKKSMVSAEQALGG
jgi:predicted sulfurtransferase